MINNLINYLGEASIYLTLCWLAYRIILARFTFFRLNRYFLLLGIYGGLLLPVAPNLYEIQLNETEEDLITTWVSSEIVEETSEVFLPKDLVLNSSQSIQSDFFKWFLVIYKVGFFIFSIRLLWTLWSSIQIILGAKKSQVNSVNILFHPKVKEPCSLFGAILFPLSWKENSHTISNEILLHEKAHVQQKHWFDLLLVEIVIVVFWLLPPVYYLKKSISINLEFLADSAVLKSSSVEEYQLQLWQKVQIKPQLVFAQTFYSTPLKTRFKMMKKQPTLPWKKAIYIALLTAFLVPSIALIPAKTTQEKLIDSPLISVNLNVFTPAFDEDEFYPDYFPLEREKVQKMTSGFGMRKHPITKKIQLHMGMDFSAPIGAKVYAVASGTVTFAKNAGDSGYGNRIDIQHGETEYLSRYAQLHEYIVEEGQKVRKGDVIGYVGSSGMSTNPHLHFEIRKSGKPIDPEEFILNKEN